MPSCPKNYPFYNWVPKPVGIVILVLFFLPILTVGGILSVPISAGTYPQGENDVYCRFFTDVYIQLYLCQNGQYIPAGTL